MGNFCYILLLSPPYLFPFFFCKKTTEKGRAGETSKQRKPTDQTTNTDR